MDESNNLTTDEAVIEQAKKDVTALRVASVREVVEAYLRTGLFDKQPEATKVMFVLKQPEEDARILHGTFVASGEEVIGALEIAKLHTYMIMLKNGGEGTFFERLVDALGADPLVLWKTETSKKEKSDENPK